MSFLTKSLKDNMKQNKVLLLENIDKNAVDYFEQNGFIVDQLGHSLNKDDLMEMIIDYEVLGIRSKTKVTKEVIDSAKNLKVIGAFCIGTDQIDIEYCSKKNIEVINAPFSNTRSVAELALGEMIVLLRKVFEKNGKMHKGEWQKSSHGCLELRNKKIGIIGYGNIGTQLSILAEALGMEVFFCDLKDKVAYGNAKKFRFLVDLLPLVDVISVHVDGRKENTNLISEKELSLMKTGVIVLNLSRGKVVDLNALAAAIKSGKVGGAAVDVFPEEPEKNGVGFKCPLQNLDNVILTPHIAGSTVEAQADIGIFVSEKIVQYLRGEIK